MAMPRDVKALFSSLPEARARRRAAEEQALAERADALRREAEERERQRQQLRAELAVTWDWLQQDGQELAAEMRAAGFGRLELLGPLGEDGQPSTDVGARLLVLMDDGALEIVRQDEYRVLRYLARELDDLLREPPAILRALIEAVRSEQIWERVAEQLV
ncbi:MAG: hypothetical protein ACOZQL_37555 [Myxococcota bacterium]